MNSYYQSSPNALNTTLASMVLASTLLYGAGSSPQVRTTINKSNSLYSTSFEKYLTSASTTKITYNSRDTNKRKLASRVRDNLTTKVSFSGIVQRVPAKMNHGFLLERS